MASEVLTLWLKLAATFAFVCNTGGTRILVGAGISNVGHDPSFEVISLGDQGAEPLPSIDNFPRITEIYAAGASDTFNYKPIICGGKIGEPTIICGQLNQNGTWTQKSSMKKQRRFSASVSTVDYGLIVIGGESSSSTQHNSIETFNGEIWSDLPSVSEISISRHCAVSLNGNDIFVIGGHYKDQLYSNQVFMLVMSKKDIIPFGHSRMKHGRQFHSCAFINKENIIVVGGRNHWGSLRSVEVFNIRTRFWSEPKMCQLSIGITHSRLLPGPTGGVYLFGGQLSNGTMLKTISKLQNLLSGWTDWKDLGKPMRSLAVVLWDILEASTTIVTTSTSTTTALTTTDLTTTTSATTTATTTAVATTSVTPSEPEPTFGATTTAAATEPAPTAETTSPLATTEVATTTNDSPRGIGQLFVACGMTEFGGLTADVEVIDLDLMSSSCPPVPRVPVRNPPLGKKLTYIYYNELAGTAQVHNKNRFVEGVRVTFSWERLVENIS